ncbi:hypothetical protein AGMMS49573_10770 [Endomicrobiia bacterium]|nr:hypothetical protein AGMMS49573_10770 [Endomicrobiia bacterium]
MALKTRNNFTICDLRSDIEEQKWNEARVPKDTYWDSTTFGVTDTVLCTADSSVWICDINGYFKEL